MNPASRTIGTILSIMTVLASLVATLPVQALGFPPSANRGAPARTAGGGVRGDTCTAAERVKQVPLTALVPEHNVGTTTIATPTLFFYVPSVMDKEVEFLLMDEAGNDVYTTTLKLPKRAGIVQIKLPTNPNQDLLPVNKTYSWRFSVICDASDRTRDLRIEGLLERVAQKPDLSKARVKGKVDGLKVAELYAKAGIWQETLVHAAQLRQTQPAAWTQLLKSVGLETLAQAPFLN